MKRDCFMWNVANHLMGVLVLPGFPFFVVIAKVIWSDGPWPHNTWGNAVHQAWQAWLDAFWTPR